MELANASQIKRFEFLAVMIWIALIGATLILAIDFQIKHSILKESEKAWEGIHAFKGETGRAGTSANSHVPVSPDLCGDAGPKMEMGTVAKSDPPGMAPGVPPGNGKAKPVPRAGNPRIQGNSKQVEGGA